VARGHPEEMRASLAATLRGVIFLSLPASLGLIYFRYPIVSLLFERGEFTAQSTELVAWALMWYAIGLVGHSVVEIMARAFYALRDTKTPVLVGAAAMSLNLVFSITFAALFIRVGWMPHGGLALANSLATALEMVGLLLLMRRRLDGLEGRQVLKAVSQALVASAVMTMGLLAWLHWGGEQATWLVLGGGIVLGGGLYALSLVGLGVREVREVVALVRSRGKR
jgi:putative peptidoglycan lipid II flippase